jgi:hypothetical protein
MEEFLEKLKKGIDESKVILPCITLTSAFYIIHSAFKSASVHEDLDNHDIIEVDHTEHEKVSPYFANKSVLRVPLTTIHDNKKYFPDKLYYRRGYYYQSAEMAYAYKYRGRIAVATTIMWISFIYKESRKK